MIYCKVCLIQEATAEVQGINQCDECNTIYLPKTLAVLHDQPEFKNAVAGLYFNKCNTQLLATFLDGFWHSESEKDL
jgi:hypothetical protein